MYSIVIAVLCHRHRGENKKKVKRVRNMSQQCSSTLVLNAVNSRGFSYIGTCIIGDSFLCHCFLCGTNTILPLIYLLPLEDKVSGQWLSLEFMILHVRLS